MDTLAVARGGKVLLSPAHKVYLDMKYDLSTPIGYTWAGCIDVADIYDWDPGHLHARRARGGGPERRGSTVVETLTSYADVEYMAFPRLAALAEVAWSPWSTHDWPGFAERLAAHGPRWEADGVNYCRSPQIAWPG